MPAIAYHSDQAYAAARRLGEAHFTISEIAERAGWKAGELYTRGGIAQTWWSIASSSTPSSSTKDSQPWGLLPGTLLAILKRTKKQIPARGQP